MKSNVALILGAMVVAGGVARAEVLSFEVDKAHTSIGFAVKHMVVSTTKGSFNDFTGEFSVDPADPTTLSAKATIAATSVDTANEKRDGHLRNEDFFDVAKYPEIKFESTGAEKTDDGILLKGNLTIKDVTKEVSIPVEVNGPVTGPQGNTLYGFEGSTKINRKDWGIVYGGVLDNGGLMIGDDVKIEISVEGIQKK